MKLLRDLLYARGNENLDISRLSSLLGVLTFLGASIWHVFVNKSFDPVAFGGGWTALCAGCGGWIYARQKYEAEGGD
ncbi:hypothetical protein GRI72_03010 [Altererythrobacter marinus]|uniref:Uncharacterized protein n=1 Tax=Pelagerythrobacter marinus TaxID=538382 RepID=A0ABW9UTS4_9SPHN|nr:hypothetical protein [Pelagerythrobacter marinus]MXO67803.1 hypothetical protein [Pelagerythrobacter marinus]